VWKLLVGQIPTASDLMMIDTTTMEHIERIKSWDDPSTFQALHDEEKIYFTVKTANGSFVDVIESGSTIELKFENREYYAKQAVEVRLCEFDVQCRAILRGLTSVVPQRALQLFTGAELEILICGDSKIEADQLKKHATYQGWTEQDQGVQRFWRAFEKLTYKERSGLVRFAWGRSRLPKEEDWSTHGSPFKLTKKNGGDSAGYPLAHTCFFQLECPVYSTDEIALQKLRFCATVAAGMGFAFA
jgi:E3 ubiquitin-protein ligase HERC2